MSLIFKILCLKYTYKWWTLTSSQFVEPKSQSTRKTDLIIVVSACAEPTTLLGRREYKEQVPKVYHKISERRVKNPVYRTI